VQKLGHRLSSAQSQLLLYFLYSPGTYLQIKGESGQMRHQRQQQHALLHPHNRLPLYIQALEQKGFKELHGLGWRRVISVVDIGHFPSNELPATSELGRREGRRSGEMTCIFTSRSYRSTLYMDF
jgi:hypothetical protein